MCRCACIRSFLCGDRHYLLDWADTANHRFRGGTFPNGYCVCASVTVSAFHTSPSGIKYGIKSVHAGLHGRSSLEAHVGDPYLRPTRSILPDRSDRQFACCCRENGRRSLCVSLWEVLQCIVSCTCVCAQSILLDCTLIWRHCVAFVLRLVLFVCVPVQGPGGSALRIVFAWRI